MKPAQKGFTGIEVVLVIVTVAALSFAGWTWWQGQQANQAKKTQQTADAGIDSTQNKNEPNQAAKNNRNNTNQELISRCLQLDLLDLASREKEQISQEVKSSLNLSDAEYKSFYLSSKCFLSDKTELFSYAYEISGSNSYSKGILQLDEDGKLVFFEDEVECRTGGDASGTFSLKDVADDTLIMHCNSGDAGSIIFQRITYDLNAEEEIARTKKVVNYSN